MSTTVDYLVTKETQSNLPICLVENEKKYLNTSNDESILDLSQHRTTNLKLNSNSQLISIDNWQIDSKQIVTDEFNDEFRSSTTKINDEFQFNIQQSLTEQFIRENKSNEIQQSDKHFQSQLDLYSSTKKSNCLSSIINIHEIESIRHFRPYPCDEFRWSKYFSLIGERSVSDEYFDHYLASIESGLKSDMKLEYCYDIQQEFYWITEIQLVSHSLIYLHYLGLPENDTSQDFWTNIYDQRCRPIGWCQQNQKKLVPPQSVPQDFPSIADENQEIVPSYLFDKNVGLTPIEQLKIGMILEVQDANRPWNLWFTRIVNNRGGRLHLRYIFYRNEDEQTIDEMNDLHLFYLDRRVHPIGWSSTANDNNNPSIYSYELPSCCSNLEVDKQILIDFCLTQSKNQFLPSNIFKEQEQYSKHRFHQGMKLEVFDLKTQNISIGTIGTIHNEFYFDVLIDNESQCSFVGHSTHPHILPARWASQHKFILLNQKGFKQTDEFWNDYTERNGFVDLASEKCFHLITLNSTGSNQAEPGMKMEMIERVNHEDFVFSVTLVHVADHLMWLRIDDTTLFDDELQFYHVLPINSLDIFPVGWAKFNGFQLKTPMEYQIHFKHYQQNRYDLFCSVTHYPKIPRVYLSDVYLLTIYINIRCYVGPNICLSRLGRIPSRFGPGPYRQVLLDMFHHLLSTIYPQAQRALRRLDQTNNSECQINMKTELVKATRKASKLIRPISFPVEAQLIHQYLRHISTQLEACPNLISIEQIQGQCPDKCHRLTNTFAFSTHSKPKRTQVRSTQQTRTRKQKSLLCHLKTPVIQANSPIPSPIPADDSQSNETTTNQRQTRGFRVHIDTKTHRVTRTNKKIKLENQQTTIDAPIKQEPVEINNLISEFSSSSSSSSSTTAQAPSRESKRTRVAKKKRSLSPSNETSRKRNVESVNEIQSSTNYSLPKFDIYTAAQYSNPLTWNVDEVCQYLNKEGCSFALETIKEQEIDGAALLLLEDLNTVQTLLEFKLGPAVKFWHVVKKLRHQVIDIIHPPPSLKPSSSSSRFSTK